MCSRVTTRFRSTFWLLYFISGTPRSAPGGIKSDRQALTRRAALLLHKYPSVRNKWLHALLASGFFKRVEKAGPAEKKGSLYEYENETTPEEWKAFFAKAGFVTALKGDLDDVSTARFASSFRRRQLGFDRWKDKPQPPYVEPTPEEREALRKKIDAT
jgi:hypothetical protein